MSDQNVNRIVDVEYWDFSTQETLQGWSLTEVSDVPILPKPEPLWSGNTCDIQKQSLKRTSQSATLPALEARKRRSIEISPSCCAILEDTSLKEAIETRLQKLQRDSFDYLIHMNPCQIETRQRLGVPAGQLLSNERLKQTQEHLDGIHKSYCYLSSGESFTAMHTEDLHLQSMNVIWQGCPKVWLIVTPRESEKLEARLAMALGIRAPLCDQFVRHQALLVPPSVLDNWRIKYSVLIQRPGYVVRIDHNAYHYVWNCGTNVAEAVNRCDDNWAPPPLYRYCSEKCPGSHHVTREMMQMQLEASTDWDRHTDDQLEPHNDEEGLFFAQTKSASTPNSATSSPPKKRSAREMSTPYTDDGISADRPSFRRLPKTDPPATRSKQSQIVFEDIPRKPKKVKRNEKTVVAPSEEDDVEEDSVGDDESSVDEVSEASENEGEKEGSVPSRNGISGGGITGREAIEEVTEHQETQIERGGNEYEPKASEERVIDHGAEDRLMQDAEMIEVEDEVIGDGYTGKDHDVDAEERRGIPLLPMRDLHSSFMHEADLTHSSQADPLQFDLEMTGYEESGRDANVIKSHVQRKSNDMDSGIGSSLLCSDFLRDSADDTELPSVNGWSSDPPPPAPIEIYTILDSPPPSSKPISDLIQAPLDETSDPDSELTETSTTHFLPHEPPCEDTASISKQIDALLDFVKEFEDDLTPPVYRAKAALLSRFKPGRGPESWLSGELISAGLQVLSARRKDVFIHDVFTFVPEAPPEKILPGLKSKADVQLHLCPIFESNHWYLISVNTEEKEVLLHDRCRSSRLELLKTVISRRWNKTLADWKFTECLPLENTSGDECGVIVFIEAEKLLRNSPIRPPSLDWARLRYLRLILLPTRVNAYSKGRLRGPFLATHSAWQVSSPREDPELKVELRRLAAGVGCPAVLEDLHGFCSQRTQMTAGGNVLQNAVEIYGIGLANTRLGYIQKALSAIYVAQRYQVLFDTSALTRRGADSHGKGRATEVYDKLIREGGIEDSASARKKLQRIRVFGAKLLRFEMATTTHCPIWMFFPARSIPSPSHGGNLSLKMYMKLAISDYSMIVHSIQSTRPDFIARMPSLEQTVTAFCASYRHP